MGINKEKEAIVVLLKDTTEAAMNDAIDYDFYADFGLVRMDKEKFAESFVRRFADGVDATRKYTIEIYDLNEKTNYKIVLSFCMTI